MQLPETVQIKFQVPHFSQDGTKPSPEEVPTQREKRLKTFNFARTNLVWEKHEKKILEAYKLS